MKTAMTKKIEYRAKRAIEEQVFPGCVIGILEKSGEKLILPFGKFTYEDKAAEVKEDSIFDVATITKTIPVACLALYFIDQGKLNLDDKVIDYIPEFDTDKSKKSVLIKHLLTNTLYLDLPGLSSFKDKEPEEVLNTIMKAGLKFKPGEKFVTSNAVGIMIGKILEKNRGESLDKLADRIFFQPLKMRTTTFHPKLFNQNRILPTEIDDWRGLVQGVVHDEITYTLQKKFTPGCSGLFTTVPDILIFLKMILNKGEANGKRYFSEKMISMMQQGTLEGVEDFQGLGWLLYTKLNKPKKVLYRYGFTGCQVAIDFNSETGLAIFTNQPFPKRKDMSGIFKFRDVIMRIIFSSP